MKKNLGFWLRLCLLILAGLIVTAAAAYIIIALTIYADRNFRTWAIPVCFLIGIMLGFSGGAFLMDKMNYAKSVKNDNLVILLRGLLRKKSENFVELLKKHYKIERNYKLLESNYRTIKSNCDATQLQLKKSQGLNDALILENNKLIEKLAKLDELSRKPEEIAA